MTMRSAISFMWSPTSFGMPEGCGMFGLDAAALDAGLGAALDADFQGRELGVVADGLGDVLVGGHADANIGAGGLAGLPAGEKRGHGAGVVAGAVAVGPAFVERHPVDHVHIVAVRV